jgi:hypothetical protein
VVWELRASNVALVELVAIDDRTGLGVNSHRALENEA